MSGLTRNRAASPVQASLLTSGFRFANDIQIKVLQVLSSRICEERSARAVSPEVGGDFGVRLVFKCVQPAPRLLKTA